ncbi:MAG: hypothetical protein M3Q56_05410 [Bacteroidota bacterium]|nr:hypothetical protein [Bacteroidota bacterium]
MQALDQDYKERLQAIAEIIQGSEELAAYLEEETPELYKALQEAYEPLVAEVYQEVADNHPLQLEEAEKVLVNPYFEGLFLPRILGYSVLRGEVNDLVKYTRPQEHFKEVLIAIANSANFDVIKQRIGQTVQVGFALSSDIWITNLMEKIENKKVKAFLQSMLVDRFREEHERFLLLERYRKQFAHYNYFTCHFPETINELKVETSTLKTFLLNRIKFEAHHKSYINELHKLINRKDLIREPEFLELMSIIANFITLDESETQHLSNAINYCRQENPNFNQIYFNFLKESYKQKMHFGPTADRKFAALLDRSKVDDLLKYYNLMETIHNKGFVHEDALDAVQSFYSQYEGMSVNNECLRNAIRLYIQNVIVNLTEPEYHSFFEVYKTFAAYINIFDNSAFSQEVKHLCMDYIDKLLVFFKDKRGKEYQEIKKFVSTQFTEIDFLTEKQVVELFKIKRKKIEE